MYFLVTQISLVLLNLAVAAFKCLENNEIKMFIIKMVPEQDHSNCINCHVTPENTKLQLPKLSEEYFTKEPSVRNILYDQLKRLIKRERSIKFYEKEQLNKDQFVQKFPMHSKYLREESKSHKLKEYLKTLKSERSPRSHGLRILRGQPWNKQTNKNLQPFRKIKYFRNGLSKLKADKQKKNLIFLRNGTLRVKPPMMTGFMRGHLRRGAYKTINNKKSKDGQDSNKTKKDEIDNIYPDFVAKEPEGFFEKMKEKFLNFIELFVGQDNVAKKVRKKSH